VSVYHLYVVEVPAEHRDPLREWLIALDFEASIHYPIPLHLQGAYEHLDYAEGAFLTAEAKAKRIVSLPIYPELTHVQQDRVVAAIRAYADQHGLESLRERGVTVAGEASPRPYSAPMCPSS
jgi:dTDP-4-amino-4,6-dideoxygalactose transaminase